jgi:hypothetical protein
MEPLSIPFYLFSRPLTSFARQTQTDAEILPPRPGFAQGFDPAGLQRQKLQSLRDTINAYA